MSKIVGIIDLKDDLGEKVKEPLVALGTIKEPKDR